MTSVDSPEFIGGYVLLYKRQRNLTLMATQVRVPALHLSLTISFLRNAFPVDILNKRMLRVNIDFSNVFLTCPIQLTIITHLSLK